MPISSYEEWVVAAGGSPTTGMFHQSNGNLLSQVGFQSMVGPLNSNYQNGTTPNAASLAALQGWQNNNSPVRLCDSPNLPDSYIARMEIAGAGGSLSPRGPILLVDLLGFESGFLANTAGAQTMTAIAGALPRNTSGDGVLCAMSLTVIPATSAVAMAQLNYTNSAGVAGRITPPVRLTNSPGMGAMVFPLADGDSGIRSIQSFFVTDPGATAGNITLVLFKPLCMSPSLISEQATRGPYRNYLESASAPLVPMDACVQGICFATGGAGAGVLLINFFLKYAAAS